jgi:hypothetical protein
MNAAGGAEDHATARALGDTNNQPQPDNQPANRPEKAKEVAAVPLSRADGRVIAKRSDVRRVVEGPDMARRNRRPLDVVVRRADGTELPKRRVFADPDDLPTLVRHMAAIARRADRLGSDPQEWIDNYEMEVHEPDATYPLFTVSSIGEEESED